eukprot:SAG31_NODE_437_length_15714_cov_8.527344_10_plen_169_part_00
MAYIFVAAAGIPVNIIVAAIVRQLQPGVYSQVHLNLVTMLHQVCGAGVEVTHAHGHGEDEGGDGHGHGHGHGHSEENLNLKTLIVHSLGDTATSVAVMLVGICFYMNPPERFSLAGARDRWWQLMLVEDLFVMCCPRQDPVPMVWRCMLRRSLLIPALLWLDRSVAAG